MSNSYTRVTIVPAGTDMNINGRAITVSGSGAGGPVSFSVIANDAPVGSSAHPITLETGFVLPLAVRYVNNTSAYSVGVLS